MPTDLTFIGFFAPILAFLIVFIVCFAIMAKMKFGHWGVHLFISFAIAALFVASAATTEYIVNVVPWFAVLLVGLFLILMLTGFVGEGFGKGLSITFVVLLGLVFLIVGWFLFSSVVGAYVPGSPNYGSGDPVVGGFFEWLYSPRIGGAILLIIVSALVSWVLVKAK
jgi:hypothetical protein